MNWVAFSRYTSLEFAWSDWQETRKISEHCHSTEIKTGYFPNRSLKHYSWSQFTRRTVIAYLAGNRSGLLGSHLVYDCWQ